MKDLFKFSEQPEFKNPSLIVGWEEDAGKLSSEVIDYLNRKIKSKSFCEIEPANFFLFRGVVIEDDIALFPESKFYCGEREDLVTFKSSEPEFEKYQFLNAILDAAEQNAKVKELLTVNGFISSIAHTTPRTILVVFNQPEIQKEIQRHGLEGMNWTGTVAISSYLLWLAKKRSIPGLGLWTRIPFYLAANQDHQAIKTTLTFLNGRFNLALDLGELDAKIQDQNAKITQLRKEEPKINQSIAMLESGLSLSEEEQLELARSVTEFLEKTGKV